MVALLAAALVPAAGFASGFAHHAVVDGGERFIDFSSTHPEICSEHRCAPVPDGVYTTAEGLKLKFLKNKLIVKGQEGKTCTFNTLGAGLAPLNAIRSPHGGSEYVLCEDTK